MVFRVSLCSLGRPGTQCHSGYLPAVSPPAGASQVSRFPESAGATTCGTLAFQSSCTGWFLSTWYKLESRGKKTLIWEMTSFWFGCLWGIFLINELCGMVQPTVGSAISRQGVLVYIRKHVEQTLKSKQVSSISPCLCCSSFWVPGFTPLSSR